MLTENTLRAIKILSTISEQDLTEEELLKSIAMDNAIASEILAKLKLGHLIKPTASDHCLTARSLNDISILDVVSAIGEELHLPKKNKPYPFEGTPEATIILSTIETFICKQLKKVKIIEIRIR